jgi:hypothetical protein
MTTQLNQEKFKKFVSEKLKSVKPFKVQGNYFGEVEVYVNKVSFDFFTFRTGEVRIDATFDFKFKQIAELTGWRYGWTKQTAGRRRNERIRHEINWDKNSDLSMMCKMFGITCVNVLKITESKSKKKKI